ncbi:hypothetical protein [Enterococcus faecalis]|uniref:hypothetical protein n=1 Tax=Enterococcus faecalis TaxID=1351 RepID=UPI0003531DE4|nr:hypothetical protein [Enterococcus faecalis]EPI31379.1 hypothetical protein D349_01235 [Enterococcus faecalis UP2S-6]
MFSRILSEYDSVESVIVNLFPLGLLALFLLLLFTCIAFYSKISKIKRICLLAGLSFFLIATCITGYIYNKKENEWKDTIQHSLKEKHYQLPGMVDDKSKPIIQFYPNPVINFYESLKNEGPSFFVIFKTEDRRINPKFYLTGEIRGNKVTNIQIVNNKNVKEKLLQ